MKPPVLIIDACQFTANYNYCLLETLAKRGQRIVYATTEFAHGYIPEPAGVKVLCCFFLLARMVNRVTSYRPIRRFLRAIEYPLNLIFLLAYVLIKRIRVVHFMWVVSSWLDYWLIRLLKMIGCCVVYTAHNPFPHEQRDDDISNYSRIYQHVDHVIALTSYTRNEILTHFGIGSERISVIPHGDYEALFSQYGYNDDLAQKVQQKAGGRKIIGFLGTIRPYKGLKFFIEAFPLIKHQVPDAFFLVAGSVLIGDKKDLQERLARCGPDDLWADIRFLPVADMKAYLSVIDVLVQPYVSGSQSGNTVMAYSAGIPVVSTDVGGLGEMVEDGRTGYVVAAGDSQAIADAVYKCLEGDNLHEMSEFIRSWAAEKYNWPSIAAQTAKVYHQFD